MQEFDETLHVTLVDPVFEAVIIAVPVNVPETLIVGVLSLDKLSELDIPVSESG